ncbi:MarR family winged helix-turn-helix transcriptional regulator [Dactylosporangium sp. CA-139066]|uniref:MarR family winged helix-turn-helix transcriptional regulator n=1 Tax=Dactylosporangium sp. CA-139066 TaxID=3239930 RepID=UPI003D8C2001
MTDVIRLMARAQKLLRAAADEAMSVHGVRIGQNLVLEVLWEHDGLSPGELAGRLQMATPTVVNTATRMVKDGLIERRPDPGDRRLVRLYLTDKGRSARAPIEDAQRRLAAHALATLTVQERETLASALQKIIEQMQYPPNA